MRKGLRVIEGREERKGGEEGKGREGEGRGRRLNTVQMKRIGTTDCTL